jgi:hypothetical protein
MRRLYGERQTDQFKSDIIRFGEIRVFVYCQRRDILKGRKGVSADFALRFERCLGISAQWLLDLQSQYDFSKAYHTKKALIEKEVDVLDLVS